MITTERGMRRSQQDGSHEYYFDGRLLANYLISSGSFLHPISRRELTREDCQLLDAHLKKFSLGKPAVEYAFDHQEDYKTNAAGNQVRDIQREAEDVLQSLYSQSARQAPPERRGGREPPPPREQRADVPVDDVGFEETIPLSGADLGSASDFPALGGGAQRPSGPPPLRSTWVDSERGRVGALGSAGGDDYPALGADAFPNLGGGGGAGGGGGGAGGGCCSRWARAPVSSSAAARAMPQTPMRQTPSCSSVPPGVSDGFHIAPSCLEPPRLDGESFPSLGGGGGGRGLPAPMPASKWSQTVQAQPRPNGIARDGAPPPPPPPPREFRASNGDFPSLVGAAQPVALAPSPVDTPREELLRRNKALMARLVEELRAEGRSTELLADFKRASACLQRGELGPAAYLASFVRIFGDEATLRLFGEVVELMPHAETRAELFQTFGIFKVRGECERVFGDFKVRGECAWALSADLGSARCGKSVSRWLDCDALYDDR